MSEYISDLLSLGTYHRAREAKLTISLFGGPVLPAVGHAVSGATGSAISALLTYPLSLLATCLQMQKQIGISSMAIPKSAEDHKYMLDIAHKIYVEQGVEGFYTGCPQDIAKTIVDSFLFFLAYHTLRRARLDTHRTRQLPVVEELGVGMIAGAVARFITCPLQNIVARKQYGAMTAAREHETARRKRSVSEIIREIHLEKGVAGFWSGYSAVLILTINPALTFMLHGSLLRMLVKSENRMNPGPRFTFLIAALSKALASTITYPFALAKVRAQMSQKLASTLDAAHEAKHDDIAQVTNGMNQATIFGIIRKIIVEEGFWTLYSGLEVEVLKGFFSHGLTMLIKERVHKFVIRAYYLILKLRSRYPSPKEFPHLRNQCVTGTIEGLSKKTSQSSPQSQETVNRPSRTADKLDQHVKEGHADIFDEYLDTDE